MRGDPGARHGAAVHTSGPGDISLPSPYINTRDVQVEYSEQCSTVYEQECVTVQEKVCREPDLEIVQLPPTDGYGVPQVGYSSLWL